MKAEIRQQLALLAKRPGARFSLFDPERPTDWRPNQVRNPLGALKMHFTDVEAWELIADKLEEGYPVEEITLEKPLDKTGYVMKI